MKLELQHEMVAIKRTEMVKSGMIPGEDGQRYGELSFLLSDNICR